MILQNIFLYPKHLQEYKPRFSQVTKKSYVTVCITAKISSTVAMETIGMLTTSPWFTYIACLLNCVVSNDMVVQPGLSDH